MKNMLWILLNSNSFLNLLNFFRSFILLSALAIFLVSGGRLRRAPRNQKNELKQSCDQG